MLGRRAKGGEGVSVAAGRRLLLAVTALFAMQASVEVRAMPNASAIAAAARAVMARTAARGLAVATIDGGRVRTVRAYGVRNAAGEPLSTDTVMYGASLTKAVFAYSVLKLVDAGRIALDEPLAAYLDKPLPDYDTDAIHKGRYGPYHHLADDPRWRQVTARHALTHSIGFSNFWWDEPDERLRMRFDPGTRYSYSGEGLILLQFAIEQGRPRTDLGALTQDTFDRLGMTRTSLMWRPDFRPNLADGFTDTGKAVPHDERSKVRVAGSMDTTIADMARFTAALVRGDGLSRAARAEMVRPQLPIGTRTQFPTFAPDLPLAQRRPDLAVGLGVILFDGPQGRGFMKGGHDEQTANLMVCLERGRRCVLLMANDVRAEAGFAELVRLVLGEAGVPLDWEYGQRAGKS